MQPSPEEALKPHRDAEHADGGGHDDLHGGEDALVHQQQARLQREDVGDDERGDGELRGGDAGFHRVGLCDGGAGVSRERDRRGDVRNDAEIEHEKVRRDLRDAERDEDRRAGARHDAVVRRGRHTHAEHDAAEHRQEQGEQRGQHRDGDHPGECDDAVDELGGETRDRDAAGDDARHGAGDGDGDAAAAAGLQRAHDHVAGLSRHNRSGGSFVIFAVKKKRREAHNDGEHDGDRGAPLERADVRRDKPDEQHEREQQVNALHEHTEARQLAAGNSAESELFRFEMDGHENTGKIEHGGQDCPERPDRISRPYTPPSGTPPRP